MPRGDSQERTRRSVRVAAVLFPVPQGVDADTDGGRKLDLRQSDKPAQRHHVVTRLESPSHEASANTCRYGGRKLAFRQLRGFIGHEYASYSLVSRDATALLQPGKTACVVAAHGAGLTRAWGMLGLAGSTVSCRRPGLTTKSMSSMGTEPNNTSSPSTSAPT